MFFKCSQQYKWSSLDELPPDQESDNLYAVLGSSLHKAMELHLLYGLTFEELKKAWKILFLNFMSEAKNLPKDIQFERFISNGYDLLRNAFELKDRWKDWKTLSVEHYHRSPFPNKFIENVNLSGRLDLVIGKEIDVAALDWKTSNHAIDADNDSQMTFYIYYLKLIYQKDYENIFGAFVHPSLKRIIFTQREEKHINELFAKIRLMLERISKNDFKKEPKLTNCLNDCTFCAYTRTCAKGDK